MAKSKAERLADDKSLVATADKMLAAHNDDSEPMSNQALGGVLQQRELALKRIKQAEKSNEPVVSNIKDSTETTETTPQENKETIEPKYLPHADIGYNELNFLTYMAKLNNNENKDTIWNHLQGIGAFEAGNVVYSEKQKKITRVTNFKGKQFDQSKSTIENYYKENVYDNMPPPVNPYMDLLMRFNTDKSYSSVKFREADFAYLTKLGVYPTNRMWVLRRFPEGAVVPNNLLDWKKENTGVPLTPLSVVVGWIPPEEENFLNIGFSESWTVIKDRVDQVLSKMLDAEFKFKVKSVAPIPGWSQGLLMAFLNKMGLTDFNSTNIPIGNPNLLQEGATRIIDPTSAEQNITSSFSMDLKTSYEQKYIGDIDPGSAMLDIIRNLTIMGSSDMIFFAGGNGGSPIYQSIRNASRNGSSTGDWANVIKELIKGFISAISATFEALKNKLSGDKNVSDTDKVKEEEATAIKIEDANNMSPEKKKIAADKRKKERENKKISESQTSDRDKASSLKDAMISGLNALTDSVLGSTAGKWKWPLIGGMGVMTGENTTPWHLTVGNPTSPFVSLGNIIVKDVNIDFNNDLGFNDIPTRINVTIKIKQGRNMGAQEVFAMFNKGYTRVYDTKTKAKTSLAGWSRLQ